MVQKLSRRPPLDAQRAVVDRELLIAADHRSIACDSHPTLQRAVRAVRRNRDGVDSLRFDRLWLHAWHWAMIVPLRATGAQQVAEVVINTGPCTVMTTTAQERMILAAGRAFDKIVRIMG